MSRLRLAISLSQPATSTIGSIVEQTSVIVHRRRRAKRPLFALVALVGGGLLDKGQTGHLRGQIKLLAHGIIVIVYRA